MDLTVDTSAVLAVVLNEPSRAQLLEVTRGAELRAPGSLPWEVGNACSALVRRGRLDAKQASLAIASYQQIPIQLVPIELEESALVDGCSRWGVLRHVVLPVARSGLFATAVFAFIFSWNEFLFALVLTRTQVITYPVQISQYFGSQSTFWAKISAMSVLGTLPVFFAVAAFQRYLVRGISLGAVKG